MPGTIDSAAVPDVPSGWPWWPLAVSAGVLLALGIARLVRLLERYRPGATTADDGSLHGQLEALSRLLSETRSNLARSTESLRLATELAEVGVWFWDMEAGVHEWTDRCKQQLGLPAGEQPSMDFFYSVVHPDDRERVRSLLDRSLADRSDFHAAYRVVHPDGTHRWLAAMGRARHDGDGKPVSMGGVTLDVTRLTQLQDALQASQALTKEQAGELALARSRFRLLAENATDVVMQTDPEGVILWISPSVKFRLGRSPETTAGMRFIHLVHPDDWNRVRVVEEQSERGSPADAEVRLRIADDGYHWFSVSMRPLFDDAGSVFGRVAGWRDIHREVLAREAAEDERRRLRAMLSGMLDPLAIFQPVRDERGMVVDFLYVHANAAACASLGVESDHLLGSRLIDRFPESESSGLLRALVAVAETGRPLVLDDFPFPLRGKGLRRMDIRGMRVDALVSCVWRDVTDRHAAAQRLAASEEQFRLLAENALDVVIHSDANDKVLWVSPSMTPVLGWKAADCVGKSALDFLTNDESRDRYLREKSRALAGQGTVTRVQLLDAGGSVHWAEVHSSPFRTAEGRIDGIVSLTRIVDAEVEVEQALERRARTDELTQLLNRRELLDRLEGLLTRTKCTVAVLWCDIDRFKIVNDAHGHAAGDAVLRAVAERIRACVRTPDDLVARIGGDEFIAVLRDVHELDDAYEFAEKMCRSTAQPVVFEGRPVEITLSIGATLSRPDEGIDALLSRADDAMYRAKEQGRNRAVAIAASTEA